MKKLKTKKLSPYLETLFKKIAHGDEEHQAWLYRELKEFEYVKHYVLINRMLKPYIVEGISIELMRNIMYDSGSVNRWNPASYNERALSAIKPYVKRFIEQNPSYISKRDLANISMGEFTENQKLYGKLKGYKGLSEVLNKFFNGELKDK